MAEKFDTETGLAPEDEEKVREVVDQINKHIAVINANTTGIPITRIEVLANTVYWGGLLVRYFPEYLDLAQLLMTKIEIRGELISDNDSRARGN